MKLRLRCISARRSPPAGGRTSGRGSRSTIDCARASQRPETRSSSSRPWASAPSPPSPTTSLPKVLVEERYGAVLREPCGLLVVTRRRVVVESVIRALVHMHHVLLPVRLQRVTESRPAGVHPLVEAAVLDHERRLDPGNV